MKKALKVFGWLLVIIVICISGLLGYLKFFLPKVGAAPHLTVSSTPDMVKRGEYLANHVCVCVDCHSKRDWTKYAGPITPGTLGQGGEIFDQKFGFPGSFVSQNITPYNLSKWTDGEIYRTITTGVKKDGSAMFPVMPYPLFSKLAPKDVEAIIAYIRTLPAVNKDNPASKADFPMNFIMNTMPQEAQPQPCPARSDQVNYGKYVATAAGCQECHTKADKGKIVGELFAGGFEFKMPLGGMARSANITPDNETGIGNWTRATFIARFKMFADSSYRPADVKPGQANTVMPWNMYAGMDTADLGAIYSYLRTIKPVKGAVVRWESPGS